MTIYDRARDAWKSRAEKAEAERDEWRDAHLGEANHAFAFRDRAAKAEAELARRNEELSERDGEIAALNKKLDEANDEKQRWAERYSEENTRAYRAEQAANRPTLDREAVKKIVVRESHGNMTDRMDNALTDAIMALALPDRPTLDREAVEQAIERNGHRISSYSVEHIADAIMELAPSSWPEWLGPKVDPDDYEVTRDRSGAYYANHKFIEHAVEIVDALDREGYEIRKKADQ